MGSVFLLIIMKMNVCILYWSSRRETAGFYHIRTWVERGLLELWNLLHQCGVVRVQAPVSSQQEATEPAVPRVSSLQAVLAGHIKASL